MDNFNNLLHFVSILEVKFNQLHQDMVQLGAEIDAVDAVANNIARMEELNQRITFIGFRMWCLMTCINAVKHMTMPYSGNHHDDDDVISN